MPHDLAGHAEPDSVSSSPDLRSVIRPRTGWTGLQLSELWRFRELLWGFALRDIKLRYKQTALGVAWVILQPIATALVFAVVFGRLAHIPSDGTPYLLFAYTGLTGWTFFSSAVTRASNSVVGNSQLITKIYFPRLLLPLSSLVSALLDLLVACAVLAILMVGLGSPPTWRLVFFPVFVFELGVVASGASCWASALSVEYRDFLYALPFTLQLWLYASPVAFSTTLIPERWRPLFALNPLVAGIEGMRWSLLGHSVLTTTQFAISSAVAMALGGSGLLFFSRIERAFADSI